MRYTQLTNLSFLAVLLWVTLAPAGENREAGLPPEIAGLSKSLRIQIDLAYRFNHRVHDARIRTVERVLRAWQASERLPEDNARLVRWLQAAIRGASPGRRGPFPPAPAFHRPDRSIGVTSPPSRPVAPPPSKLVASPPLTSVAVVAPRVEALARSTAEMPDRGTSWNLGPTSAVAYALPALELNSLMHDSAHDSASKPMSSLHVKSADAPVPPAMPDLALMESAFSAHSSPVQHLSPSVRINREELFSRMTGYRHRLRGIEAQLVAEETPSARKLVQLAQELDYLVEQYDLLALYCKALGDKATAEAAPLRTTEVAWRQMSRSIAARRRALDATGRVPSEKERQIELSILEAIERHTADVTGNE